MRPLGCGQQCLQGHDLNIFGKSLLDNATRKILYFEKKIFQKFSSYSLETRDLYRMECL